MTTKLFSYCKKYWVLLFILILVGGFLRFYKLDRAPYWMDEGYTINAVLSIDATGHSILDSGKKYSCPLYCFPSALAAKTFGDTAFAYRLLAALSGTAIILLIYAVAKRFVSRKVGALAAAVVTFSYLEIAWSRQARWYTLFALFFWVAIYCFYKLLYDVNQTRPHKIKLWVGMIVATLLACLSHGLGYLLPFLFLGWYLVDLIFIQKKFAWHKIVLPVIATGATLIIIDFAFGLQLFSRLWRMVALYNNSFYYLSFLWRTYFLFIIFAAIALIWRKPKNKPARFFLLFIFLAYALPLFFLTNLIQYRYLFHATPALLILGVIGMYDVYQFLKKPILKIIFALLVAATFFTVGGGTLMPHSFYLLETDDPAALPGRDYYAYTPQPDWNSAYEFIKTNKTESDLIISSMPQFNKIFLGIPGYWIKYNYTGRTNLASLIQNDKEFYVNAVVLDDLNELKSLTAANHGYIIFDYMAFNGKLSYDIVEYITSEITLVYNNKTNSYSEVWVFQF